SWFNKIADVLGTLIFKYDQLNQRMKKYRRIFSGVLTLGGSEIGKYIGEKIGTRALGGPVSAGSSYLVGEQGPELFTPRNNGSIISNHRLGGGNITVNVYGDVSGQELIEKVEQGIFNKLSLNGKLPI
ncbi:MAG: hypothetical protein U9R14_04010, partial [Patescibacteria group bacterium]|nr:hypothetical protein [Patescibacteria group bacterium]